MGKTVAILQARMGSTRLPGKVLTDLCGEPVISRVVTRAARTKGIDEVVVATTTLPADEALASYCRSRGWAAYRGSPDDLTDRYYQAATLHKAETVIRMTCDCPMIDPELSERVIRFFRDNPLDYASHGGPPQTFPRGVDTEVFTFAALERAWKEDKNPAWREHATPYIYKHPELFRVGGLVNDVDYSRHRWTVDTPEDLAFVRKVYEAFGHDRFTWREAIALLDKHPDWLEINRSVIQKEVR